MDSLEQTNSNIETFWEDYCCEEDEADYVLFPEEGDDETTGKAPEKGKQNQKEVYEEGMRKVRDQADWKDKLEDTLKNALQDNHWGDFLSDNIEKILNAIEEAGRATCYVQRKVTSPTRITFHEKQINEPANNEDAKEYHKEKLEKAKAKVKNGKGGCGTGILLFPKHPKLGWFVITNNHVIMDDKEAQSAQVVFDYLEDFSNTGTRVFQVSKIVAKSLRTTNTQDNKTLDFSILLLKVDSSGADEFLKPRALLWEESARIQAVANRQFLDMVKLNFLPMIAFSHPHGLAKRISIGQYPTFENYPAVHITHKLPTTGGSSGANLLFSFVDNIDDEAFQDWKAGFVHYRHSKAIVWQAIGNSLRASLSPVESSHSAGPSTGGSGSNGSDRQTSISETKTDTELEVSLSSVNKAPTDKPKKDDLKNNSKIRSRIKGLPNLGNTCFFNAVMQNLCQTELLHVAASCAAQEGFSQHSSPKNKDVPPPPVTVQEGPGPVTKALWKLLQDFRSSSSSTLDPKQLFGEISEKATRFKGNGQQDSQELLRYLLDSIQIEERERVKRAIPRSFVVCSDDDSKMLDENKRGQGKEYDACVEAPLIDSVFAGRFVSIVICRQCQQEFKKEETFLDLSLPLTAPQQKKGKKGKGHGKGGKGKTAHEAVDNKKSNKDDDEEDEQEQEQEKEKDAEGEDDELDQMNVSDLDGSDNEQERKLNEGVGIDKNSAKELPIGVRDKGSEERPDNDACVEDEKRSLQQPREMEEDCNSSNLETNNQECEEESLDAGENEVSSMDISNSGGNEIISSKCNSDNVQRNTEDLAENEPCPSHDVNQLSSTVASDSETEKEDQHSHDEQDVQQTSGSDASVLTNVNEIVKGIENLALNAGLEKEDNDFRRESVSKNSSADCTLDTRGDDLSSLGCAENSLKDGTVGYEGREDETLVPTASLPGGNSETASVNGKDCSTIITTTDGSLNGVEGDAIESQMNERDAELVKNDEDLEQEIEITENQEPCSDSGNETQETGNAAIKSEGIPEGSETDSEDEHEHDSGANEALTLQPAYHPSPGECSVMSCLSQFCASELLDGSNKFPCEECSRRTRRSDASNTTEKERNSGDEEDGTDEDECKGAKASKSKEQQIVYTVATKQLLISLAPPVLTLHLKRFQQERYENYEALRKLDKHVDFPLELNLAPFCSRSGRTRADSKRQVLYSLYGVVQHDGDMNNGHYTAYVKVSEPPVKGLYDGVTDMSELTDFITNMWIGKTEAKQRNSRCRHEPASDGQWFHVDDSRVSSVPETEVLNSQAYMLFYRRLPLRSR